MTHQVLARKWRPRNFTEIVGQEHVVQSLINALKHERLHHAYLFTGTRGVGKTTIARILAKALNCEAHRDFDPCGQCPVCRAFDEGRFLDLIEVDAASRTKVEDTRDLLENAQYAPNRGKYKVYLIDEVHMLSGHSFNALLKTLEEPPPHVKFLLATTDPQKIPATVLSRCLQFNLKRLSPKQIGVQMEFILNQENISYELPALQLLARAADGSMRDGLSLLDQAIVFGNGTVYTAAVGDMLGTAGPQLLSDLLRALATLDAAQVLREIDHIAALNPKFADILAQFLSHLHRIAIAQAAPQTLQQNDDAEQLKEWANWFSAADIQLYYQIALLGQRDLEWAPEPRTGFEMTLLRMLAFRPAAAQYATESTANTIPSLLPKGAKANESEKSAASHNNTATAQETTPPPPQDWGAIAAALKIGAMTRELANNCVLEELTSETCVLLLDPTHKQLLSTRTEENLRRALHDHYGKPLKVIIHTRSSPHETPATQLDRARQQRQADAEQAIACDENVQLLKEHFDARIVAGSVEPLPNNT
ncbi:MAG: DNA polymerase III subunit gamma/tau [Gammaproteobacteria bacterium]